MPSPATFSIPPIRSLLGRCIGPNDPVIDPFAADTKWNENTVTNDQNPATSAQYHLDALEFVQAMRRKGLTFLAALLDGPYSPRQVLEDFNGYGRSVTQEDTRSSAWRRIKDAVDTVVQPGGLVICFGWNSGGMGVKRGYVLREVLLVVHGGNHNDTIVTVWQKRTT